MTIKCKICRTALRSEKPDTEAFADLMERIGGHLRKCHPQDAESIGLVFMSIQALSSTYLLFHFIDIPDSEQSLRDLKQANRDQLYNALASKPDLGEPAAPIPATLN